MNDVLMDIKGLKVWYKTYQGYAKVVDGINLYVCKGEKVGLVGESGCGKTTTMKTVLRVLDGSKSLVPEGEIFLNGQDILKMKDNEVQKVRRDYISMISQAPSAALNPVFTIEQQLIDVIKYSNASKGMSKKEMYDLAISAVKSVMISDPERILKSYPHQLSGGMKQRICIAMSLVTPRELLIADEPGTALDVTIQDQIHRLLRA
jgi:peptide/nickel transport system ATP-binding protein